MSILSAIVSGIGLFLMFLFLAVAFVVVVEYWQEVKIWRGKRK